MALFKKLDELQTKGTVRIARNQTTAKKFLMLCKMADIPVTFEIVNEKLYFNKK